MNSRRFIDYILITGIILSLLGACNFVQVEPQKQPGWIAEPEMISSLDRPNIILLLTDDLDSSLVEYMPNLQKLLIQKGVYLDNYFINVPQCCPSRSTILLGEYSQNTGILRNGGSQGGFKTFFKNGLEQETIAVALQKSGYRTGLMGKYLNGYPTDAKKRTYVPPGWDEWYVPSSGTPYSNYFYKLNENGKIVAYQDHPDDYLTDVLSDKAVGFINENSKTSSPFFLFISTYAPHGPFTPAPRHIGELTEKRIQRTGSFNEEDITDKPKYIQNLPALSADNQNALDQLYIARLQSVQAIDEMILRLTETLKSNGAYENTYIIFSSDNGLHLGQHRLGMRIKQLSVVISSLNNTG